MCTHYTKVMSSKMVSDFRNRVTNLGDMIYHWHPLLQIPHYSVGTSPDNPYSACIHTRMASCYITGDISLVKYCPSDYHFCGWGGYSVLVLVRTCIYWRPLHSFHKSYTCGVSYGKENGVHCTHEYIYIGNNSLYYSCMYARTHNSLCCTYTHAS